MMAKVQASRTAKVPVTWNEVSVRAHGELKGGFSASKCDSPCSPILHLCLPKPACFLPGGKIIANQLPETIKA